MKTWKNKLCAIVLVLCGLGPIFIDRDATALAVFLPIGLILFFEKDNVIDL